MLSGYIRRRYLMLWQLLLLALGTSWLWAPLLNPGLSDRLSLISDYETPQQPYSWLFRLCDALAGLLIIGLAWLLIHRNQKIIGWLVMVIGICFFLDPLLPTTCRMTGNICTGRSTPRYFIHGVESVAAGVSVFLTMVYDSVKRKKLVSWTIALLQAVWGVYFLTETAKGVRTHTIFQYAYETSAIAWLAWFGRDFLAEGDFLPIRAEFNLVKSLAAAWAFANGVFAIVISLAHIHLAGNLKGLYFAGDNAWLAQHGVIIGVVMLYLSRHLARGERRARQIFLLIVGIEALKYAIITPSFALLALYSLTFIILFIFRDDFDRGILPLTWTVRLRDLYYMVAGLLLASGGGLLVLDRDDRTSIIANRAFGHFTRYVSQNGMARHSHLRAVLLDQTLSVFLAAASIIILWILFRPYKYRGGRKENYALVEEKLLRLSGSSEDFFKFWPRDKQYFWTEQRDGFVAYKTAGAAVFALADPVAKNKQLAADRFIEWARSRRLKVCFLPIYSEGQRLYESAGLQLIQIGASAVIDIRTFLSKTSNDKWWRWQKNRAVKKEYVFVEFLPPHPAPLMRQLERISDSWLKVGGHSEYGFALGHFDKDYLNRCQLYCLKGPSGQIIAFTNRVPQFNSGKTVTIDMLRYFPEFNNAMSFLLYKTIESVAAEDKKYKYFDLGFVPFAKAKGPVLTIARTLGGSRFSARGLEQFKNKFDPAWQPNYMAYDGDIGDLATIALRLEQAMQPK